MLYTNYSESNSENKKISFANRITTSPFSPLHVNHFVFKIAGYEGFISDTVWNISAIPFKSKLRDYNISTFEIKFTILL